MRKSFVCRLSWTSGTEARAQIGVRRRAAGVVAARARRCSRSTARRRARRCTRRVTTQRTGYFELPNGSGTALSYTASTSALSAVSSAPIDTPN